MKTERIIAIIPARMASSRFPGKPLADILGLPMIEHVRRRVRLCPLFADVVVATCDQEILDSIQQFGGRAVLTSTTHERCTDRVAEAALGQSADIIANIQGDEPLIRPEILEALLAPLREGRNLDCTNLMAPITEAEAQNPNLVKVVCDLSRFALYFSREPIPSRKKAGKLPIQYFKQLGIYAFRSEFLQRYTRLAATPMEAIESVDMMRLIEHGYRIRMVPVEFTGIGVDTPADLDCALEMMKADPIWPRYRP